LLIIAAFMACALVLLSGCTTKPLPPAPDTPEGVQLLDLTKCGPIDALTAHVAKFGEKVVGAGFAGEGTKLLAQLSYASNSNWSLTVMDTNTGHACFVLSGLGWRWFKPGKPDEET
jgi:hypothetical protein